MKLKTSQSTDPFVRKFKTEKKEMRTQVAFGQGNSSYARSFPMQSSAGIKILCVSNVLSLAEPSTW
jgi:DNA-directed RNA polymerase III subunit RPC4